MINTANGPIEASALGRTLMHEHLMSAFPGWETDRRAPPPLRRDVIKICVDRVEELKAAGFSSLVDPCPCDLGRDVDLLGEVAALTGFNILFATGLFTERYGSSYWRMKAAVNANGVELMTELMVDEITQGVGSLGIKPAVIKIGTGVTAESGIGGMTEYEKCVLRAAAAASSITGAPITTHTEGILGDQQAALLLEAGVPPSKVIIGHCCRSTDHDYIDGLCSTGTYIGFDQFGIEMLRPDADRIKSLMYVMEKDGGCDKLIISQDTVWCWRGTIVPDGLLMTSPLHFTRNIQPALLKAGVSLAQIDSILVNNPKRYFS